MITLFEAPTAFVQIDGKKVVARPINYKYRSLRERLRDAWWVFTGRCEAVLYYHQ